VIVGRKSIFPCCVYSDEKSFNIRITTIVNQMQQAVYVVVALIQSVNQFKRNFAQVDLQSFFWWWREAEDTFVALAA
jgi:hypothetical protein